MTTTAMRTKPYHTRFGGIIYSSDFNTDFRGNGHANGSSIANRIAYDHRFDEQCRKNSENRDFQKDASKKGV